MSADATRDSHELQLALRRLASTPYPFAETDTPPSLTEGLAAHLVSEEAGLAVSLYLAADAAEATELWQRLGGDSAGSGFPPDRLVGLSGRLVYDISYSGPPEQGAAGNWRVAEVAGAIAGQE